MSDYKPKIGDVIEGFDCRGQSIIGVIKSFDLDVPCVRYISGDSVLASTYGLICVWNYKKSDVPAPKIEYKGLVVLDD